MALTVKARVDTTEAMNRIREMQAALGEFSDSVRAASAEIDTLLSRLETLHDKGIMEESV